MSCFSWFFPYTRMSSMRHTTPSRPCRISDIRRWKTSGADVNPNGRRWKQNLPKGVMKVVRRAESFVNSICQKTGVRIQFREDCCSSQLSWKSKSGVFLLLNCSLIFTRSLQSRDFLSPSIERLAIAVFAYIKATEKTPGLYHVLFHPS